MRGRGCWVGEVTGAAVLDWLRIVVRPAYHAAGWSLRRVLTDDGAEQHTLVVEKR